MLPHRDATAGQAPLDLGSSGRFAVLAASEITSVPTSALHGDVGLSPSARSKIAGLTPVEVVGTIFAADDGGADAVMLTGAQGDLTTAYNDAAGRTPVPDGPFLNPGSGNLGGLTLVSGLYKFTGAALISGSDLTLTGSASDVWIFRSAAKPQPKLFRGPASVPRLGFWLRLGRAALYVSDLGRPGQIKSGNAAFIW